MTRKHDDIFAAVLSGAPDAPGDAEKKSGGGARFLKRGNAISARLSGEQEEKTLRWVDPAECRMWARHNRDYALLTEENCRDLIEGIRSQGRQEFPAIVRRVTDSGAEQFEVICGARRHFAVSWLRANNYRQFKYLVEVRDLSDEEAFRLADIENRDREDISDYERARDYAQAIDLYYGSKQRAMAERLEVTEVWLSRYLDLARLPAEVVAAFASIRDIRELHARRLKPLLKSAASRERIFAEASKIAAEQEAARQGQGAFVDPAKVAGRLNAAGSEPKIKTAAPVRSFRSGKAVLRLTRQGRKNRVEFDTTGSREDLEAAFKDLLAAVF